MSNNIKYRSKNKKKSKPDIVINFEKNHQIRDPELRVIDADNNNIGVISREEAMQMAQESEMDLVIIARTEGEIPVARIVDWTKLKYQLSKKRKNSKAVSGETKEWWFYPKITDHDIQTKLSNVEKYLKKGGRAKLTVKFKRRVPFEDMKSTMDRIIELFSTFAESAGEVTREGGNLVIFIKLKK